MLMQKKITRGLFMVIVVISLLLIIFGERARSRSDINNREVINREPSATPTIATAITPTATALTADEISKIPAEKNGRYQIHFANVAEDVLIFDTQNGRLQRMTRDQNKLYDLSRPAINAPTGANGLYQILVYDFGEDATATVINTATAEMWRVIIEPRDDENNEWQKIKEWQKIAPPAE